MLTPSPTLSPRSDPQSCKHYANRNQGVCNTPLPTLLYVAFQDLETLSGF